jgi:hypothetical protein
MTNLDSDTILERSTSGTPSSTTQLQHASADAKIALAVNLRKGAGQERGTFPLEAEQTRMSDTQHYQHSEIGQQIPWPDIGHAVAPRIAFVAIQEWEGYVISIEKETFTAQLVDKTRLADRPEEVTEFPLADIRNDDKPLLMPGAIFRWSVGYQNREGTKERVSRIIFRRLPAWTKKELDLQTNNFVRCFASVEWK